MLISELRNKISILMIDNNKLQRKSKSKRKRQMSEKKDEKKIDKNLQNMKRSYLQAPIQH